MRFRKFLYLLMIFMCLGSILLVHAEGCTDKVDCTAEIHNEGCPSINKLQVSAAGTQDTDITINGVNNIGGYRISIGALDTAKANADLTNVLDKYRSVISALSGIGALTMLLFFIINFGKLGASAGNPQQRQSALMGLLFTGIATALLGSIMIFFTFFYKVFST